MKVSKNSIYIFKNQKLPSSQLSYSTENSEIEIFTEAFSINYLVNIIKSYLDEESYLQFKNINKTVHKFFDIIDKKIKISQNLDNFAIKSLKNVKNINKIEINNNIDFMNLIQNIEINKINTVEIKNNINRDYNYLSNIDNLTKLKFESEKTDLKFLSNIKKLDELKIYFKLHKSTSNKSWYFDEDNYLLNSIKLLTNIKILDISKMVFINLSNLSSLSNNLEELNLHYCELIEKNYDSLSKLKKLKKLDLSYSNVKDISFIKDLTELNELNISFCYINNFTSLNNLKNLKKLSMNKIKYTFIHNNVNDLSFLLNLNKLEFLDLNENNTENHLVLSHLNELRILKIEDNNIQNIIFLESLINLEELHLSFNDKIINYSSFSKLNKLKKLSISFSDIDDISFLESLQNLETLNISFNKNILDFDSLKKLKKLKLLNVMGTNFVVDSFWVNNIGNLSKIFIDAKMIKKNQLKLLYKNRNKISVYGEKNYI